VSDSELNKPAPDEPQTAVPPEADASAVIGSEAAELQKVRDEAAEYKDRWLRSQAELDNYRKRAQREMADGRRYAGLDLLRDLLPVLDNLQRAVESAEKSADSSSLLQGVQMVRQQLETLFQQHQCQVIDALHQPFDPAWHEAILQMPNAEHPANTVIQVTRQGYRLHDRVVRPSQVIVSSQPQEPAQQDQ